MVGFSLTDKSSIAGVIYEPNDVQQYETYRCEQIQFRECAGKLENKILTNWSHRMASINTRTSWPESWLNFELYTFSCGARQHVCYRNWQWFTQVYESSPCFNRHHVLIPRPILLCSSVSYVRHDTWYDCFIRMKILTHGEIEIARQRNLSWPDLNIQYTKQLHGTLITEQSLEFQVKVKCH